MISYLVARPSRDIVIAARQAITVEWWQGRRRGYDIYISALVEEEISSGDPEAARLRLDAVADVPSLAATHEAQLLATRLVADGAIPESSLEDALHIGIAAAHGMEYLLTWNFRHINNAETKAGIVKVIEKQGYICPVLCSPEELGA
ncbi:MAG: type II toxin-antitoxin system VapC family toxin [Burkholderiales bacterium]